MTVDVRITTRRRRRRRRYERSRGFNAVTRVGAARAGDNATREFIYRFSGRVLCGIRRSAIIACEYNVSDFGAHERRARTGKKRREKNGGKMLLPTTMINTIFRPEGRRGGVVKT